MSSYPGLSCECMEQKAAYLWWLKEAFIAYFPLECSEQGETVSLRDNFRYPVRWWSVQNTPCWSPRTFLYFSFCYLYLTCLFCSFFSQVLFPLPLPPPAVDALCFSAPTCPLSPSPNICLWWRKEGEKRLLANCQEWWGGSDWVRMSSSSNNRTYYS